MSKRVDLPSNSAKPAYVRQLEESFGAPSQAAFGSAVFFTHLPDVEKLEETALAYYQYFVGDAWTRFGADAWMAPWRLVYTRSGEGKGDILAELRQITDREAKLSASVMLEGLSEPERAEVALVAAFDDAAVSKVVVYNLGDGDAMSGVMIAGQRGASGEATFLTFLLD